MLTINSVKNGIVIDHIRAGHGIKIFNYLGLDRVDYSVALIMNAESKKLGKKDIIKIENNIDVDFTVLGFLDPNVTIDVIKNETIEKKIKLSFPKKVTDVIKCKNPRCITSTERNLPHVFELIDEEKGEYKCQYCDEIYRAMDV